MLANCKIFGRYFLCKILDDTVVDDDGNNCIMVKMINGPYKATAYIQKADIKDETLYDYTLKDSYGSESIMVLVVKEDANRVYLQAFNDEDVRFSVKKENFKHVKKSTVLEEIEKDFIQTR